MSKQRYINSNELVHGASALSSIFPEATIPTCPSTSFHCYWARSSMWILLLYTTSMTVVGSLHSHSRCVQMYQLAFMLPIQWMFSEESWVYCAWYIFLFWHIVFLSTSIGWIIPEYLWNSIIFNVVNWNFPKSQKIFLPPNSTFLLAHLDHLEMLGR